MVYSGTKRRRCLERERHGQDVERRDGRLLDGHEDPGRGTVTRPGLGGISMYSTVRPTVVTVSRLVSPTVRPFALTATAPPTLTVVSKADAFSRGLSAEASRVAAGAETAEGVGPAGEADTLRDGEAIGEPLDPAAAQPARSDMMRMAPPKRSHPRDVCARGRESNGSPTLGGWCCRRALAVGALAGMVVAIVAAAVMVRRFGVIAIVTAAA